jgi:basic amino acid/polyamine antiporter, APA family
MPLTTTRPSVRTKGHLLRILGVGFGIAIIVGGAIGSGILRTPGLVAAQLGSPALIVSVWLAGGIYAFCCTLSVIELGTMLPRAGGWYVYSRRAFGEYAGFSVGCIDWIAQAVAIAYLAVAFADFASELLPSLNGYVKLVSVVSVVALTLLNWVGLRAGSRTQKLTCLIKSLALIVFVVACFVIIPQSASDGSALPARLAAPKGGLLLGVLLALQAVIITYDGWYFAIYFTEEDSDPARNLPRSSIIGVLACLAVYVLINMALLHVLPMNKLAGSEIPGADAAMAIFGGRGKQFILILAMVTVLSALNATVLLSCRILFGMGRDGWLPRWLASVNSGGTPSAALLVVSLASIVLILSGGYERLIAVSSFLVVVLYLSGFSALFALRAGEPDLPRPFKAWGYPWTNLGVLLASAAFLVATVVGDLKDALFTLILIALSYPVYFFVAKSKLLRASTSDAIAVPLE